MLWFFPSTSTNSIKSKIESPIMRRKRGMSSSGEVIIPLTKRLSTCIFASPFSRELSTSRAVCLVFSSRYSWLFCAIFFLLRSAKMKIDKMDNAATMTVRTDNIRRFTLFTAMPSRSLEFAQSFPKIGNTQFQYNISDPNSIAPGNEIFCLISALFTAFESCRFFCRCKFLEPLFSLFFRHCCPGKFSLVIQKKKWYTTHGEVDSDAAAGAK